MGSKRTGRLLAALGCAAIVSLVAPVAAHAAEPVPVESVTAVEAPAESAESATVEAAATASFTDVPPAQVNVEYRHQLGFTGTATTFIAEHLPDWLSMDSSGLLTGLPTVASAEGSFKVAAVDRTTMRLVEQWMSIPVLDPGPPVITGELPAVRQNEPYSYQVQATAPNGTALTFTASGLPTGFSITPGGLITSVPLAKPGSYPVTITATTNQVPPVSSSVTWTLDVIEAEKPVITDSFPTARQNQEFSHQVEATTPADTTVTISATGLPKGFSITPSGLITGKPDMRPGSYPVIVSAMALSKIPGRGPVFSSVNWTLEVAEPEKPVFTGTLPPADFDTPYAHEVQATAPADTTLTFTASGLPEGYSMTAEGRITGKRHAKLGSHPVTITATAHQLLPGRVTTSSSATLTLDVTVERPVLAETVLPTTIHNAPYSYQVSATAPSARPVLTYAASGLPDGLSMSADGLITGRAKASKGGKFPVTIDITASAQDRPSVHTLVAVTVEVKNSWWDELGRYHVILHDSAYTDLNDERVVHGDCPGAMFLDVRSGTDGRMVGQGFNVDTDSWTTVFTRTGVPRYLAHPDGRAASGMDLRVTALGNPSVYVEMVCTADPAYAWKG